uniref:Uncharacterized protein n=1 Tax=Cucumis melo TaxID=3656 RepID=A0A9I9EHL2_CUCME
SCQELGFKIVIKVDVKKVDVKKCHHYSLLPHHLFLYSLFLTRTPTLHANDDLCFQTPTFVGCFQTLISLLGGQALTQCMPLMGPDWILAFSLNALVKEEKELEDFANHNAFDLPTKYDPTHLVFNDDIHGTALVVLAGLISALKVVGGSLFDHRFSFLGAGEWLQECNYLIHFNLTFLYFGMESK